MSKQLKDREAGGLLLETCKSYIISNVYSQTKNKHKNSCMTKKSFCDHVHQNYSVKILKKVFMGNRLCKFNVKQIEGIVMFINRDGD